jgi:hypothetical protein
MEHIHITPNTKIIIETEGEEKIELSDISEFLLLYDSKESTCNSRYFPAKNIFSILGKCIWFTEYLKGVLNK